MNALQITRRLRPFAWTLAALGLLAIVAWQALTWTSPSTSAADHRAGGTVDAKPGLKIFPPDERLPAPTLEGTTLDGDPFSLSDWAGRIVVINVWGSWCGPCRAETPDLVRLAREYDGRGVRFVGINTRDNPAAARSFDRRFAVPYPSVVDQDGRVLLGFRNVIPTSVVPSSVIVDRQGDVGARIIGPVTYSTLKGLLDDEISRAGGAR